MHQRVTTDPLKLLHGYEQGRIVLVELVDRLIEATISPPTTELIALLPEEALTRIRERAAVPRDAEWLTIQPGAYIIRDEADAAQHREAERARLEWFRAGLEIWREYFG